MLLLFVVSGCFVPVRMCSSLVTCCHLKDMFTSVQLFSERGTLFNELKLFGRYKHLSVVYSQPRKHDYRCWYG